MGKWFWHIMTAIGLIWLILAAFSAILVWSEVIDSQMPI